MCFVERPRAKVEVLVVPLLQRGVVKSFICIRSLLYRVARLAFRSHRVPSSLKLWSRRQSVFIVSGWVERPLIDRQISASLSLGVGVQFSSLIVVPLLNRVGLFLQ